MRVKLFLIVCVSFFLSACYVYRTPQLKKGEKPLSIQQSIVAPNRYEVMTNKDKIYKIKAVKWQQDTLIAYINGNEKKELKLNQNQIKQVKNRVFSRGRSDALTFSTYTFIGAVIYFLMRR